MENDGSWKVWLDKEEDQVTRGWGQETSSFARAVLSELVLFRAIRYFRRYRTCVCASRMIDLFNSYLGVYATATFSIQSSCGFLQILAPMIEPNGHIFPDLPKPTDFRMSCNKQAMVLRLSRSVSRSDGRKNDDILWATSVRNRGYDLRCS